MDGGCGRPGGLPCGCHPSAGCYFNLFRLMAKCGVLENLLLKEHTHTFCNKVRAAAVGCPGDAAGSGGDAIGTDK